MTTLFIARHATPDRTLKTIPYDIPPGPPLSPHGAGEALALGAFLHNQGLAGLYHSPFARAAQTAEIIAAQNQVPLRVDDRLAEWRSVAEPAASVRERMRLAFEALAAESLTAGPLALVSHGGPIAFLLQALGIAEPRLADYRKRFDTTNPLPPAGAWSATWQPESHTWALELAYLPASPIWEQ